MADFSQLINADLQALLAKIPVNPRERRIRQSIEAAAAGRGLVIEEDNGTHETLQLDERNAGKVLQAAEAIANDPHYLDLEKKYRKLQYDFRASLRVQAGQSGSISPQDAHDFKHASEHLDDAGSMMRNYVLKQLEKWGIAPDDQEFVFHALESSFDASETAPARGLKSGPKTPAQQR